jgi:Flp pilus assembly protein TadD
VSEEDVYTQIEAAIAPSVLSALHADPPKLPDERVLKYAAKFLWDSGLVQPALTAMRLLDQLDALDADDLHKLGCWQLYLGNAQTAKSTIERALKLEPDEAILILAYAYAFFYLEDYDAAATLFEELLEDTSLTSPPKMVEAARRLRDGLTPDEIVIAPIPALPNGMMEALQVKLIHGHAAALEHIARVEPTVHGGCRLALQRLAVEVLLELKQDRQALERAEAILTRVADDGYVLYLKGIAARRLGKSTDSHMAFERAVSRCPLEPRAWAATGAGFMEKNQPDRAWRFYRIAVFLDRENPNTWGDIGMCQYLRGDYEHAAISITRAIELGAHTFTTYLNRALSRQKLQDVYGMMSDFNKAIALDPNHPKSEGIRELLRETSQYDDRFPFGEELLQDAQLTR